MLNINKKINETTTTVGIYQKHYCIKEHQLVSSNSLCFFTSEMENNWEIISKFEVLFQELEEKVLDGVQEEDDQGWIIVNDMVQITQEELSQIEMLKVLVAKVCLQVKDSIKISGRFVGTILQKMDEKDVAQLIKSMIDEFRIFNPVAAKKALELTLRTYLQKMGFKDLARTLALMIVTGVFWLLKLAPKSEMVEASAEFVAALFKQYAGSKSDDEWGEMKKMKDNMPWD